jgi:uncharacterized protein DUF5996
MPSAWPAASYEHWSETCDTLHAHAQVLGKLAAKQAPPEPGFQHVALRLTTRGWETLALRAPDGSGAFGVALDLRTHEAVVEHSDGHVRRIALTPDRPVGNVTRDVLAAARELAGEAVAFDPAPQEVPWSDPLDSDERHARYDPAAVAAYFGAATQAAQVLAALRAPHEGRSTPVNAWWGSFDLAVSLSWDAPERELAVGWWPGGPDHPRAAFYAYAKPAPDGFESDLPPAPARWDPDLGEHLLHWDDVISARDPFAHALQFARAARERLVG